jgi:hypothetical protein
LTGGRGLERAERFPPVVTHGPREEFSARNGLYRMAHAGQHAAKDTHPTAERRSSSAPPVSLRRPLTSGSSPGLRGGVERWRSRWADAGAPLIDTQNPVTLSVHQPGSSGTAPSPRTMSPVPHRSAPYTSSTGICAIQAESGRSGDRDYHLVVTDDSLTFRERPQQPGVAAQLHRRDR